MRKQWWGNNSSTLSLKWHCEHFWYFGERRVRHGQRWTGKPMNPHPSLWSRAMAGEALPPVRPLKAQLWCALEQAVFFCAAFWHSTLFLYTLVSHPATIPDIQWLAGHGCFYWKIKNLSKLLFSLFLFFFFFFFFSLRNRGCKLFEISQKPNSSFACVFEMAP